MSGEGQLEQVRRGGKAALTRALAALEAEPEAEATLALLDAACLATKGVTTGLTGPPGVGKSTLAAATVRRWRVLDRTVAVVAVDPSSRRSGGALLGDRTRIVTDEDDNGVFVRSLAARDRLGGTADLCAPMLVLLRALFDEVLLETVGVGQSETEVSDLVDSVVLAIQPASGDSLQYMKAGVAEIPNIAVVTKADLGEPALRAQRELEAAMAARSGGRPPVLLVAAPAGQGVAALIDALDKLRPRRVDLERRRAAQGQRWVERWIRDEFGRRSAERVLAALDGESLPSASPFRRMLHAARAASKEDRRPAGPGGGK